MARSSPGPAQAGAQVVGGRVAAAVGEFGEVDGDHRKLVQQAFQRFGTFVRCQPDTDLAGGSAGGQQLALHQPQAQRHDEFSGRDRHGGRIMRRGTLVGSARRSTCQSSATTSRPLMIRFLTASDIFILSNQAAAFFSDRRGVHKFLERRDAQALRAGRRTIRLQTARAHRPAAGGRSLPAFAARRTMVR
jgi:hypothetical protein